MKAVFIGGSRNMSRLNSAIRARLDRIVEQSLPVFIGDANGADKAVQQYLNDRAYSNVQVFCMKGHCRNNVGDWPVAEITAPRSARGAEFYSIKDREMTGRASLGLMLWDGKSSGTLANILRLISQQKPVVVYHSKLQEFTSLKTRPDLDLFLNECGMEAQRILAGIRDLPERALF